MVRLARIVAGLTEIQIAAREANVEVAPKRAIILNGSGDGEARVDGTLFRAVTQVEVLLLQNQVLGRCLGDGDRIEGRRESNDDIDMAVLGPDGCNLARNGLVLSALIELSGTEFERWYVA